jgi:ABC-type transport system substrate-binding protein
MLMWGKKKNDGRVNKVDGNVHIGIKSSESSDEVALLKRNQSCIVDKIGRKIEETGFAVENLIGITQKVSSSVEIQMESISKVASEIANYSALAEEVFASTEDSKRIAQKTMEAAQEGSKAVNKSIGAMMDIQVSVDYAKNAVNELNSKAEHINEMLNAIKDISKHTNLLSLNASIEAARAGEAGRGFAVVAQEVKNLAQRSSESAEYISRMIKEINESITVTMEAMDKSGEKVKEGSAIASNTLEVFNNIIGAVNTAANVAEEINSAVSRQTQSLEAIIDSTEEMNAVSRSVMSMVETATLDTQYTKAALKKLSEVSKNLVIISNKLMEKMQSSKKSASVLRTCLFAEPLNYDPAMAYDHDSGQILVNVHSGILTIGTSGEVLPGIAKSWRMEEDNLTWVFNLRKGAKFHNGVEITSEDVKYTYERLLNPEVNSPNSWYLDQIEGAAVFAAGKSREVKGIRVLDRYRIALKLTSAYSGFLLNLAQFSCSIVSKSEALKGKIVGCGPYVIEEKSKEGCVLSAFEDFYGGSPYVDKITIKFSEGSAAENFINNRYDFIMVDGKTSKEKLGSYSTKIKVRNMIGSYYIGFNLESKSTIIQDKETRKALNYAVNKKRIIDEILGGMAVESKSPIPPDMVDNSYLEGFNYNPGKAREIMRKKGSGAQKLKIISREGSEDTVFNKVTRYLVEDLKEIGIECLIEKVPLDKYLNPQTIKNCDLFVSRWIADTGDPDNFLQPLFNPATVTDFTRYDNEEVTNMLNEAKGIVNPQKRMEMYKTIQKKIVEDIPWIFLYHPQVGCISREGVMGISLSTLGLLRFDDIIVEN